MKIAILGAGNVGLSLARGWRRTGHAVTIGSRDPERRSLAEFCQQSGARSLSIAAACDAAETIVLAVPWAAVDDVIEAAGPLSGKPVIDCTNPIAITAGRLELSIGHTTSGGELVAARLPEAHVIKTLNQIGAERMSDNDTLEARPVMFVAGDDADAKAVVTGLVRELGFEPQDAGGLISARLLEPFGMLWINQSIYQNAGRNWAFGMIRPERGR